MYSFWSEGGVFSFSMYNKLNTPLYIDWKKSSFVLNNDKLNYWSDEIVTKSSSLGRKGYSYLNNSLLSVESGFSSSVKPEQITFIAPKSIIYKIQFKMQPKADPKLSGEVLSYKTKANYNKKVTTKIVYKEFYIDNGFYLFKVSEMEVDHLSGKENVNVDFMTAPTPFKNKSSFYTIIK